VSQANEAGAAHGGAQGQDVSSRWPELLTALALAGVGAAVMADSLRIGAGWADDGPKSGYFPFYIGLLLLGASVWNLGVALRGWRHHGSFAERAQLRSVMAMLWPCVVYVVAIRFLGIYVASALLIAFFTAWHGKHHAALCGGLAVGVPLFFFAVFEHWFLVPLPKGPLEAMLGL
jgi:hypothetical protein